MDKTARYFLEFEQPVAEVAGRIADLRAAQNTDDADTLPEKNVAAEIKRLEIEEKRLTRILYRELSAYQKVQIARHPQRPHAGFYVNGLLKEIQPLAGDRAFADDAAMLAGLGRFNGKPVAYLGTEKGATTQERMKYSFGMPRPEGYRKARRIMELANRFNLPLLTFVDTPGAFPGVDAEARGQGEAIAACIETSLRLNVPIISTIIGEGGSGGALALATADKVLMLEHSIYSVISPEGCASILWKQASKETIPLAAEALKLTAQDLLKLGVVDEVIKEPVGAAHANPTLMLERVQLGVLNTLHVLSDTGQQSRAQQRRKRFLTLS